MTLLVDFSPPTDALSVDEMDRLIRRTGDTVRASRLLPEDLFAWLSTTSSPSPAEVSKRLISRVSALRAVTGEGGTARAAVALRDEIESLRIGLGLWLDLRDDHLIDDLLLTTAIEALPDIDRQLFKIITIDDVIDGLEEIYEEDPELSWWHSLLDVTAPTTSLNDAAAAPSPWSLGTSWATSALGGLMTWNGGWQPAAEQVQTSRAPRGPGHQYVSPGGTWQGLSNEADDVEAAAVRARPGQRVRVEFVNPTGGPGWASLCLLKEGGGRVELELVGGEALVKRLAPGERARWVSFENAPGVFDYVAVFSLRPPRDVLRDRANQDPRLSATELVTLRITHARRFRVRVSDD